MFEEKGSFKKMLENGEQVFAPSVWDCFSAKAVRMSGFKAMLLSGAAVSKSMIGMPDLGIMTADELIYATERIAAFSPLPLIVDFDEGYGDSPLNVYRNVKRLVQAGAQGFTLDDGQGVRGYERLVYNRGTGRKPYDVMPMDVYLSKIKAALAAVEGTDCVVIARTESRPIYGFDDAIERVARAKELGAHMTLINRVNDLEECKKVAANVPGWKMYPDVDVMPEGVPMVKMEDLKELGFNFVTVHYLEKGSMWGMLLYGKHNYQNQNAMFSVHHQMDGLTEEEKKEAFNIHGTQWLDLEKEFQTIK